MNNRLVTYENVAAAAQTLLDGGSRPSVSAVRATLGGGSPNDILPLLNQWKQARPVVQGADIVLDPQIGQLIAKQIGGAVADAVRAAEQRSADVQADADAVAEAGRDAEKTAALLASELEAARSKLQQQTGQLEERGRELELIRESSTAAIAAADEKAEREREAAESVRQDLVRAQIRIEAIPRLESEIDALMDRLTKAEGDLAKSRQVEAVAVAKLDSAIERQQDLAARLGRAETQIETTQKELAKAQDREREALLESRKSADALAAALKKPEGQQQQAEALPDTKGPKK